MDHIHIRKYKPGDAERLWEIHDSAVRRVCIRDYTEQQVKIWAGEDPDAHDWRKKMDTIHPFVADIENRPVGYADLQADGLIDHFFVHADFQGRGVGSALMNTITASAQEQTIPKIYSHVSITAKPFFLHHGFKLVTEQQVMIRGCEFTNYRMERVV